MMERLGSVERVLIWGAGGHGKVVADLVRACGYELAGYVDGNTALLNTVVEPGGATVLAGEEELADALAKEGQLPGDGTVVAPAIGNNAIRLRAAGLTGVRTIPPLIHPRATVGSSLEAGPGTVVLAGAVINAAVQLGQAVIINSGAIVEHDCEVADGAHVSPGAIVAGEAVIGHRSWIGAGAVVIEGIRIGADVTVGAGAVVIRDVPDRTTVVGVPAQAIARTASRHPR